VVPGGAHETAKRAAAASSPGKASACGLLVRRDEDGERVGSSVAEGRRGEKTCLRSRALGRRRRGPVERRSRSAGESAPLGSSSAPGARWRSTRVLGRRASEDAPDFAPPRCRPASPRAVVVSRAPSEHRGDEDPHVTPLAGAPGKQGSAAAIAKEAGRGALEDEGRATRGARARRRLRDPPSRRKKRERGDDEDDRRRLKRSRSSRRAIARIETRRAQSGWRTSRR